MDVRLSWALPTPSPSQRPIMEVAVEISANPATLGWTPHATVPVADPQEMLFQDVSAGENHYRVIAVDDSGAVDPAPPAVMVDVPFDPPSSVVNLTAELV